MKTLNFLRTSSVYFNGIATLVHFYFEYRSGATPDLGILSLILLLASVSDYGIYNDLITNIQSKVTKKYLVSIFFNSLIALIISLRFSPNVGMLFFVLSITPFWYLRFFASSSEIIAYVFSGFVIVTLTITLNISVVSSYLIRIILGLLCIMFGVIKYIKINRGGNFVVGREVFFLLLSTVVSNFGLIFSNFSSSKSSSSYYFYDKIGLLTFVIFQFVTRLRGETNVLNDFKYSKLLVVFALILFLTNYFIIAKYVADMATISTILLYLKRNDYFELIFLYLITILIVLCLLPVLNTQNPWALGCLMSIFLALFTAFRFDRYVLHFIQR